MLTSSASANLKIGIVGFGNFSQFLAKTIIKQGHTLRATSRTDCSELCTQMGIEFFRNASEILDADNDVVLIGVSILSLSEVLNSMPFNRIKRPILFVDVLSVKEHPRDLLLRMLPEESDILCTHPMFGPQTAKDGWRGLSFMYDKVRVRDEAICSKFLQIFASEGCKMVEMSCEEHDKVASKSQFLAHTIGRTLGEMGIESTPVDTKGFQSFVQLLENLEKAFHRVNEMLIQRTNEELDLEKVDA